MAARAVMVLGTTSGAGKSWLATALCRWYARQGLTVAPFKAQNMSNNARVVPADDGASGEIGSAQYFQALAARAVPDVRMNPVLLKPERDTRSQVVVLGRVRRRPDRDAVARAQRAALAARARGAARRCGARTTWWSSRARARRPRSTSHASDYVNMRTAREADAACLLVTDIDRGGAFAHLYGTRPVAAARGARVDSQASCSTASAAMRRLLAPGPDRSRALTGVPTVAVLPMWREHGLPEEDGGFTTAAPTTIGAGGGATRIAIVAFPRISQPRRVPAAAPLSGRAAAAGRARR